MRCLLLCLVSLSNALTSSAAQLVWAAQFGGYSRYDDLSLHTVVKDTASGIAVDRAGNTYVTGTAVALVPQVHPLTGACASNHCVFVTKIAPDGKTIVYSTYVATPARPFIFQLGLNVPIAAAIVSDPDGNVYVTGAAFQLPRTDGGTVQSAGDNDVFVIKLDRDGVLKASMLIGGSGDDQSASISLGPDGYLYIAGATKSDDFPVSTGAYRTTVPGPVHFFSLKIDPKSLIGDNQFPNAVVYSSVFGTYSQSSSIDGQSLSVPRVGADTLGNAYVSVYTDCTGMDATVGAIRGNCQPGQEGNIGVVAKINPPGTKLLWAAMPTGSGASRIQGLGVTPEGFTYIVGTTTSADFPVTPGAFNTTKPAIGDGFLAKLNWDGTALAFATYLADSGSTTDVTGIAVDSSGNAYVAGGAASTHFPILNSIQYPIGNCCAGFVTVFKPDGSGLVWSTLLGFSTVVNALTIDEAGNVYAAGYDINPSATVSILNQGSTIDVVKISPGGRPIPIDGIVNAASFQPGLPMSGGLASMFVHGLNISGTLQAPGAPLPLELAGVSILVNGIPAPILSVTALAATPDSQQINFQVPFDASVQRFAFEFGYSAESHTSVELRYRGASSFGLPVTAPPGIFTLPDGSGAVQHSSDYSLVTPQNPVVPGEVIIVYVTGLGPVKPPVATGSPATGPAPISGYCYTPPTINVGDVLYAGLTVGIPGLYQMNVRVAPNAASGTTQMYITWTDCEQIPWSDHPVVHIPSQSNSVSLPIH